MGVPPPPHTHWLGQLPQLCVPPQPLETVPHWRPEHACAWVNVVHVEHWRVMGSHAWPPGQVPQLRDVGGVPPQPLGRVPQVAP